MTRAFLFVFVRQPRGVRFTPVGQAGLTGRDTGVPTILKGLLTVVHDTRRQVDVLLPPHEKVRPPHEGKDNVKTSHGATVKGQVIQKKKNLHRDR